MPEAIAAKKKRWALVYPNFEYGQSAAENFKEMMKKAQPDVEFVTEQAPPLGKIDAGAVAQAIDDAKPDAIFNVLFGGDLAKFVREGNTRGVFKDRTVVSLLSGEPEYLDPLEGRGAGRLDRHRLSVGQDQDAGAPGIRRCLQEEIQRLSAARLDRRLCDDDSRSPPASPRQNRRTPRSWSRPSRISRSTARLDRSGIAPAITRPRWVPMSARLLWKAGRGPWRTSNTSMGRRCFHRMPKSSSCGPRNRIDVISTCASDPLISQRVVGRGRSHDLWVRRVSLTLRNS